MLPNSGFRVLHKSSLYYQEQTRFHTDAPDGTLSVVDRQHIRCSNQDKYGLYQRDLGTGTISSLKERPVRMPQYGMKVLQFSLYVVMVLRT